MKSFAPKGRTKPIERIPFEFTVMRDEEPEVHRFQARAVTDTASLAYTLSSTQKHPERALTGMLRLIGKMLDNKDGTPADWAPKMLPLPGERERTDDQVADALAATEIDMFEEELAENDLERDENGEIIRKFRGPDGQLYPLSEAERFLKPEAGSSRRRWRTLMEEDDDAVVDGEALGKLFEWLVGLAAGRPTPPSP
jgi:hypothetical protein